MRELSNEDIATVSGGSLVGTISMGLAVGWSSGILSLGVGSVIGGPIGGMVGAAAGFTVGAIGTIAYGLATEDDS